MDRVRRRMISKRAKISLTSIEKFVSSGKRKIRGLASSARVDRHGDIVEPDGGLWALPVPLLWGHSHKDPVGWVRSIDLTSKGLWIEAELAQGIERADSVWKMIETGLVDSFSIGFRPLKSEPLPSGGERFTKWELLEISVVVVPSNVDAKISRGAIAGNVLGHPGAIRIKKRHHFSVYGDHIPGHPGAVRVAKAPPGSVRLIRRAR